MTLTRTNVDEQYYVDRGDQERDILKKMDTVYSEAITLNQSFWSEADLDTRFKAGDQTLWNDVYGNLPAFRKKQFYFNRIRRIVNMITGYQRKHRKSVICIPVENSDEKTASQYTKLLYWAFNRSNAQENISRAFDSGSVTTGMSLLNVWLSYDRDPVSGDIHCDHIPYNGFLIDPYFKKSDLSDCNFIWRRQWLSKMALKGMLPGREKEIDMMNSRGNRDGKFQFQAEAYNYAMYELLSYDEYWYKDLRDQIVLVDLQTGETMEWQGEDEQLDAFLTQYPQIKKRKTTVPTVKLAIVVEGKVMYDGPNPMGIDRYPFVPFLGYYEPEIPYFSWRIQGVVRGLRDSQFLYNRRKIIELDILESQVTSGFKYKVDSLVNPKDIYLQGEGRGIALKKNADMRDVEQIVPPPIPPSMIQLSQMLGEEIQQISGVNEELLGSADDDKAGILSMLRQGAGLTTLQTLFDQLDNSVKHLGSLYLDIIQKNFTAGKVRRIIEEEPTPQFYNKEFGRYDVEIEEGLNTTTQRQLQFAQLLQLREAGIPIPGALLLESSTIQNKQELQEAIQKAEQQQQQAQEQQNQIQMMLIQKQAENYDAQATANTGLGLERLARINENKELAVERRAKAIEDLSDAKLNKVKMMKELEEMDITKLRQLVEILNIITEDEDKGKEAEEATLESQVGMKGNL